jgi:hypothetical protein
VSYCRWSSDWFRCDLYVYEHVDGYFAIHVAGRTNKACDNLPPEFDADEEEAFDVGRWLALTEKLHTLMGEGFDDSKYRPLNLPHDDETFEEPTYGAMIRRVEMLVALGYRVPKGLVASLRADLAPDGESELECRTPHPEP